MKRTMVTGLVLLLSVPLFAAQLITETWFPSQTKTATPTTLVAPVNIADGALTVAAWPVAINSAKLTATVVDANDSMTACTLAIVGVSPNGLTQTDTVDCNVVGHVVSGVPFRSITSLTLSAVAGAAAGDTIQVRTGPDHYYVVAVPSYGQLDGVVLYTEATAATGGDDDSLTVKLQQSVDGIRWAAWMGGAGLDKSDIVSTSVQGDFRYWTFQHEPSSDSGSVSSNDFAESSKDTGPVGNFWRLKYQISNASGDPAAAPSFTFSVKAALWLRPR